MSLEPTVPCKSGKDSLLSMLEDSKSTVCDPEPSAFPLAFAMNWYYRLDFVFLFDASST